MIKKGYKYVFKICLLLFVSINLLPFQYIQAETVSGSSPIIGVNIKVIGYDYERTYDKSYVIGSATTTFTDNNRAIWACTSYSNNACAVYQSGTTDGAYKPTYKIQFSNTTNIVDQTANRYLYEYEFILDNNYVGYITFAYSYVYDSYNTDLHTQNTVYVNGSSFTLSGTSFVDSWTVADYQLSVVDNQNWLFPLESYSIINSAFDVGLVNVGFNKHSNYLFPIFKPGNNTVVGEFYLDARYNYDLVMIVNGNAFNWSRFSLLFDTSNLNLVSYNPIQQLNYLNDTIGYIINVKINPKTTGKFSLTTGSNVGSKFTYIPIYFNNDIYSNVSIDFAINFGLNNEYLNNTELMKNYLNIMANGNNNSNSSVSSADTTNNQLQSATNQEEQLINNAENDMQQKLNNLNIQNQNNNLFQNSKFIGSAYWVKQQFDYFTNNNAYGYLITFSLVIGISLVIIGKLRG